MVRSGNIEDVVIERPEIVSSEIIAPLIVDMLTWIDAAPRRYAEVMDIWRTSCPRLTVWEDALDAELVAYRNAPGAPVMVEVTRAGAMLLAVKSRLRRAPSVVPVAPEGVARHAARPDRSV